MKEMKRTGNYTTGGKASPDWNGHSDGITGGAWDQSPLGQQPPEPQQSGLLPESFFA